MSSNPTLKRIDSIDVLRGIVMVIMALDHVRDFVHDQAYTGDPLNVLTTTPVLYFTRWITHLCAPTFVFLSGLSIYLQSIRKSKAELSSFLFKRGIWLVFVELVLITLAITFNPFYNLVLLQVIWAIGISMILLGFLSRLPYKVVLAIGLVIVLGHNVLDFWEAEPGFKAGFWWDLFHHGLFAVYPIVGDHYLAIMYPFVPWTGLMILGYCFGVFFTAKFTATERQKILTRIGSFLLVFFVVLRAINVYGDPHPWSTQANGFDTFLSFINVNKYPPSLAYMSVMIGIAILALAFLENIHNKVTNVFRTFGRTAFFYYILHFYLAHLIAAVLFFYRGHSLDDAVIALQKIPFFFQIPGEGYSLEIVYLIWILLIAGLYPLCKWYDSYKTAHKEKWWLSYL
ncbi:heparan-alpha-glucosaminide N-acetyltransferase domain-containing protein [Aquirufa sp. KTFRIE-69F]|uniref:Heparan-alpha-glucosaminide N-acetyltransferase domain-containing protein n=1 Tax=Aquirufa originis TaxID=3096514 RepID=A0ABW6D9P3_9BACT